MRERKKKRQTHKSNSAVAVPYTPYNSGTKRADIALWVSVPLSGWHDLVGRSRTFMWEVTVYKQLRSQGNEALGCKTANANRVNVLVWPLVCLLVLANRFGLHKEVNLTTTNKALKSFRRGNEAIRGRKKKCMVQMAFSPPILLRGI